MRLSSSADAFLSMEEERFASSSTEEADLFWLTVARLRDRENDEEEALEK